jgi:hypothetical protein
MAVKVLRHGNSIFPIQIICLKCGALLLIENPRDLKIVDNPSTERVAVVNCPDCKSQVVLHEADTPQALAEYDKVGEWR